MSARAWYRSPKTRPRQGTVHGAGKPNRNTANTTGKVETIIGLGDEVYVVVLDAVLDDPKRGPGAGGEGAAHGRKHAA